MSGSYKKRVLGNGLKLVAKSIPGRQSLALGIWIKVGGRYEANSNKGASHFLEHLLFKGSRRYSCRKIKESIEGIGGSLNGFTSEELTCFFVKIPGRYLETALDVLSDMVIYPSLPASEVEKEKTVIIEEIKMYKDQPQSHVYELLDELLWPKQPLGAPVIGRVESLRRMKRKDLRLFKEKYYTPANIVVTACGLCDWNKLDRLVGRFFSCLKKKDLNSFSPVQEAQDSPQLKLSYDDTEQTHIALGFHSLRRDHRLKHALNIMHIILGANMSSRLFNELREKKGLAYEIGTLPRCYHDTGSFTVHAGVDNNKVIEAVALILKELKKIRDVLISQGEFKRAKEFYLGQLMIALEDTLDHMLWFGETTATIDKVYTLEEIAREVNSATPEDIRQVARDIFKENNLNLALIGPLKEGEQRIYSRLQLG